VHIAMLENTNKYSSVEIRFLILDMIKAACDELNVGINIANIDAIAPEIENKIDFFAGISETSCCCFIIAGDSKNDNKSVGIANRQGIHTTKGFFKKYTCFKVNIPNKPDNVIIRITINLFFIPFSENTKTNNIKKITIAMNHPSVNITENNKYNTGIKIKENTAPNSNPFIQSIIANFALPCKNNL